MKLILVLLIVALHAGVVGAENIFDDDWTPPTGTVTPPSPKPDSPATPPAIRPDSGTKEPVIKPIPSVEPTPRVNPPRSLLIPAPATRGPIPDKADLATSRKLFRQVFAAELNDNAVPARRALALKLIDSARKCGDKRADLYVLLAGARKAAIDARDLSLSFGAADALAAAFEVDPLAVKVEDAVTAGLQGASTAGTSENCQRALVLLDDLVDAEDFADAAKLATAMLKSTPDDPFFKRIVPRRAKEIEAMRSAHDRLGRDLEKLRTAPEDPIASQSIGAYLCFGRGDWVKGLPLLAKSGNPEMKKLAAAELAAPDDTEALHKLADGWAAVGPRQVDLYRQRVLEHAIDVYRKGLAGASGIQKLAIEMSIAKTAKLIGARRVDLLPTLDPAQDALSGTWSMKDGQLVSTDEVSRFETPYTPPDEYVYRIEFTATHEMKVMMDLWKANKSFMWVMGNGNNKEAGFDLYKGLEVYPENATYVSLSLDSQKPHTAVVEVYNDRIRAWVDGQLLRDIPTRYAEFGQNTRVQYTPRDPTRLAVSVWNTQATFQKIEVIELSGPGTLRR